MIRGGRVKAVVGAALMLLGGGMASGEVPVDPMSPTRILPDPSPHWVWLSDIVFPFMVDGRAWLVDADSGEFLGMLNTGFGYGSLVVPPSYKQLYSPETYFSRGTRGTRTDVVTFYDPRTLFPTGEVEIPPKRISGLATLTHTGLTDDERFLIIYNFTPAQSVTVVDVEQRRLVGEFDAAGCALVLPSGARRFQMICADGSLLTLTLSDTGEVVGRTRGEPFFDPDTDPVTEKAVRWGDTWVFASFEGYAHLVDVSGSTPKPTGRWSLFSAGERAENWRIGGFQHLALHEKTGRLYSLVHQGGKDSHKDPGTRVLVYDLAGKKKIASIDLTGPALLIQVTQDDEPLLLANLESALEVHDARSGAHLRSIAVGLTPITMQTPRGGTD